jgi:hypothetical protein
VCAAVRPRKNRSVQPDCQTIRNLGSLIPHAGVFIFIFSVFPALTIWLRALLNILLLLARSHPTVLVRRCFMKTHHDITPSSQPCSTPGQWTNRAYHWSGTSPPNPLTDSADSAKIFSALTCHRCTRALPSSPSDTFFVVSSCRQGNRRVSVSSCKSAVLYVIQSSASQCVESIEMKRGLGSHIELSSLFDMHLTYMLSILQRM